MKWLLAVVFGLAISGSVVAQDGHFDINKYSFPVSSLPTPRQHWKHLGDSDSKSFFYVFAADPNNAGTGVFTPAHLYTDIGIAIATKGIGDNYTRVQILTGQVQCGSKGAYPSYVENTHGAEYDPGSGEPIDYDRVLGMGDAMPIERGTALAKAVVKICDAVASR